MRRRTLFLVLAGLAVVVAAGVVVLWPRPEPDRVTWAYFVTLENCRRCGRGMTCKEVEAILGPPGDYSTGPTSDPISPFRQVRTFDDGMPWPQLTPTEWKGDKAIVVVFFDATGNAIESQFAAVYKRDQHPLDNLLWRAKRQWRRWFPE
jgi:hypothetical protein